MEPPNIGAKITCIPLHKSWQMNLLWPMNPPQNRAEMPCIPVHQTWQINLCWLIEPPGTRAEMICLPLHKTWQMTILWLMAPGYHSRDALNTNKKKIGRWPNGPRAPSSVPEQRCLEYHYTNLGRQMYFGWWTTQVPEQRWLAYHLTKLGRWTYFGQRTPSPLGTREGMPWIPIYETFQTKPTLPNGNPKIQEQRWLAYYYTKLGRWTYFDQWNPQIQEQRWLAYYYTKLVRWTYFGQWTSPEQSRDALHTSTPNLAD